MLLLSCCLSVGSSAVSVCENLVLVVPKAEGWESGYYDKSGISGYRGLVRVRQGKRR